MKYLDLSEKYEGLLNNIQYCSENRNQILKEFYETYHSTLKTLNIKASELARASELTLENRNSLVLADGIISQLVRGTLKDSRSIQYLENNAIPIVKDVSIKIMDYLAKLDTDNRKKISIDDLIRIYREQDCGVLVEDGIQWGINIVYKNMSHFKEPHIFWNLVAVDIENNEFNDSDFKFVIDSFTADNEPVLEQSLNIYQNEKLFNELVPDRIKKVFQESYKKSCEMYIEVNESQNNTQVHENTL